jgi:hypothetical protein
MSEQYIPSSGTEGACFFSAWCCRCARDKSMREGEPYEECDDNEVCEIIAKSFTGEATEWIYDAEGWPVCTAFIPAGDPIPPKRCEHTADMFGGEK